MVRASRIDVDDGLYVMVALLPVRRAVLAARRRFACDERGVAMLEFALASPLVLVVGLYGVEIANQALTIMKINQIALALADNASRVGVSSSLSSVQLRELDINDVLQGARLQGAGIDFADRGRATISSLENVQQSYDAVPVQRIHWQRCLGARSGSDYDSQYTTAIADGTLDAEANKGTDAPYGLGTGATKVMAPLRSGVMYVEVNYRFKPLFGSFMIKPYVIKQSASFLVRDKRDFSQIYNPATSPATPRSTCDLHTA